MRTFTYTTDAAPGNEPVVVQKPCNYVRIYEDGYGTTAGYTVKAPALANSAVTRPAGADFKFKPQSNSLIFAEGEIAGYTSALSGSLTMAQEEGFE